MCDDDSRSDRDRHNASAALARFRQLAESKRAARIMLDIDVVAKMPSADIWSVNDTYHGAAYGNSFAEAIGRACELLDKHVPDLRMLRMAARPEQYAVVGAAPEALIRVFLERCPGATVQNIELVETLLGDGKTIYRVQKRP